jgi:16S rRNA (guanine966-N2)-methyltransferase
VERVTRIIAGSAGSLRLRVPKSGTRPTSDRVREGIFSSLEAAGELDDARVLDLYAGSGALGLESISRGAAEAVLVDKASDAVSACRANAAIVAPAAGKPASAIRAVLGNATTFLAGDAGTYDLVFLDPPYGLGDAELSSVLELLVPRLAEDATVVVERAIRSGEPPWPPGIEPARTRSYGDTAVHLAHRA